MREEGKGRVNAARTKTDREGKTKTETNGEYTPPHPVLTVSRCQDHRP